MAIYRKNIEKITIRKGGRARWYTELIPEIWWRYNALFSRRPFYYRDRP